MGLQKAVGLADLRPGHDALQVSAHEGGDFLHWRDLGAHDAGAPVLEHGANDIHLHAIKEQATSSLSDFVTFLFAFAVSKPSHETL